MVIAIIERGKTARVRDDLRISPPNERYVLRMYIAGEIVRARIVACEVQ